MLTVPPSTTAPQWVLAAWALPTTEHEAIADGIAIRYRCWNAADIDKPGLLFVHGFLAHGRWWDHIAPQFVRDFRVYAMDLAGMGDSGHREEYPLLMHSHDIAAVIDHAGIGPATVVGHSYGGSRLLRLCADRPEMVQHAVVIDSMVFVYDDDTKQPAPELQRTRRVMDYASMRARYRLIPEQSVELWALDYIAHHSLISIGERWTWKFDTRIGAGWPEKHGAALLRSIGVPVDYICGEISEVVSQTRAARIAGLLPRSRGPVLVPFAGHHVMLDQPLATIGVLRALLTTRMV